MADETDEAALVTFDCRSFRSYAAKQMRDPEASHETKTLAAMVILLTRALRPDVFVEEDGV